jgi:hypothetical protein
MRISHRLVTIVGVTALVAPGLGLVAATDAGAAPEPVTVTVTLDQGAIRADGRGTAAVTVDASTAGGPWANGIVKLAASWTTPKSPGAAKFLPGVALALDAAGHGTATVTSTRSGTALVTAKTAVTGFAGAGSAPLDARRRSAVVFVGGASSTVTCSAPTVCGDPFNPFSAIRAQLAGQGFTSADLPTYSYAGGAIDTTSHQWIPKASTCADSGLDYRTTVARLRGMIRAIGAANPNTDVSLVGVSQGGLLVMQMLAAQTTPLPKGSRLVDVISLDGAIGGVPLPVILNLENTGGIGASCWSEGGTSRAAIQIQATWNTTAPDQGPGQADRATLMCRVVGYKPCSTAGTNQATVASRPDVHVETWGSSQDGVFDPSACQTPGTWPNALDTQVVTGAGGGLHPEGATPGAGCTILSHIAVLQARALDVATAIGPQQ